MDPRRTAHTEAELIAIFQEQNIDEKFYPRFLAHYKFCFDELFEDYKNITDEEFDEDNGSIQKSALFVTGLYTELFIKLVNKGHSEELAHLIAYDTEEGEREFYYAYEKIKEANPELARQDLLIHCKSHGGDEYFEKYYLDLYESGDGILNPIQNSTNYSKFFKEQISKGKSEIYAHQYADFKADEYHEIYCEEYAYAYEKAITEKKSLEYAKEFARMYGAGLLDIKRRYGIADDQELIDFKIEEVNGYMKAWDYARENKLVDSEQFIKTYTDIHLKTYFADKGMPEGSIEQVDEGILNKALQRFA